MRNLIGLIVGMVGVALCARAGAMLWMLGFAVLFLFFAVRVFRQDSRDTQRGRDEIVLIVDELRQGLIATHKLVAQRLFGHPEVSAPIIEKLVNAASYLGNPTPPRGVIGPRFFVAWHKQGLQLLEEAKSDLTSYLDTNPFAGGAGDTIR